MYIYTDRGNTEVCTDRQTKTTTTTNPPPQTLVTSPQIPTPHVADMRKRQINQFPKAGAYAMFNFQRHSNEINRPAIDPTSHYHTD